MAAFVAVADHGGFAAAAKRLERSAPAVTRQVAALEEHLGLRLFHRTTRKVALSDAGQRYLERARRILSEVEHADAESRRERATPSGRFTLTAPTLFGRLHVTPLLMRFLSQWPLVRAELLLSDSVLSLVDGGIDLAVRIGQLSDSAQVAVRLGTTRRVRVASPRYLDGRRKPRSPAELEGHALIHLTALAGAPRLAPRLTTNSPDAALAYALRGGGIAEALGYQVAEHVEAGRLVLLLEHDEPAPLPVQLVYPSARQLSANVRAFIEVMVAAKRELLPL